MWRRERVVRGFRAGFCKGWHDQRAFYAGIAVGIAVGLAVLQVLASR